jgi:hypothetical protein
MTMTQRLFEIKYVEPKAPFYQLADLPSYTMDAELFEYNDQHFDTGWDEIDQIEWKYATSYSYIVNSATAYTLGELVTQYAMKPLEKIGLLKNGNAESSGRRRMRATEILEGSQWFPLRKLDG